MGMSSAWVRLCSSMLVKSLLSPDLLLLMLTQQALIIEEAEPGLPPGGCRCLHSRPALDPRGRSLPLRPLFCLHYQAESQI